MIVNEHTKAGVTWVDVADPAQKDFLSLVDRFELHSTSIQDCMEPEHLPKFEQIEHYRFLILRAIDSDADKKSDSVQKLTNKLAIFFSDKFVLTFHRVPQPYVESVFNRFKETEQLKEHVSHRIVAELMGQVARTYDGAVHDVYKKFEAFETEVFEQDSQMKLQSIYLLKRRTAVIRRMLKMMEDPIYELMKEAHDDVQPHLQTVVEHFHKLTFQIEEVRESLISLLSLQVSLVSQKTQEASHKANEVMRVLTILSAFIMPLNFVASFYGMNFVSMPELQWPYGNVFVIGLMITLALSTFIWFKRKGWLSGIK